MLVHGSCVDLDGAGVLLRGPSGSGKSDLVLRLIDGGGARLVADDQVALTAREGALLASAPSALAGLLEVRGLGVAAFPYLASSRLLLAIDLVRRQEVERMPAPAQVALAGVLLPLARLCPHDASAPARLRLALRLVAERPPPQDTPGACHASGKRLFDGACHTSGKQLFDGACHASGKRFFHGACHASGKRRD